MRRSKWFILIGVLSACILALAGCGGGGDGGGAVDNTNEIRGLASKGPLANATVNIYAIDADGQVSSNPLATTTTDGNGNFTIHVETNGAVLCEVVAGTYVDEATGEPRELTQPMRVCLSGITADTTVAVTPLTEIATRIAATNGFSPAAIDAANTLLSQLTGCDIACTLPANPNVADQFTDACPAANYALLLAALSQMDANAEDKDLFEIIGELKDDLQDSELNLLGDELTAALSDFLSNPENKTGRTSAEELQNAIADTVKPYSIMNAHVMYRTNEGNQSFFFVYVGLAENGHPISESAIEEAKTHNSDGELIPVTDGLYRGEHMRYDCLSDTCRPAAQYAETGIWSTFAELPSDTYAFAIDMENNQNLTADREFAGRVEVPYVSGETMSSSWNGGDLRLAWDNPTGNNWDEVDQLRIMVYDNSGNTATGNEVLHILIGPDKNSVDIPAALVARSAALRGGTALVAWQIHTRAYDVSGMNYSRGYSRVEALTPPQYALAAAEIACRKFESENDYCLATGRMTSDGSPIGQADVLQMGIRNSAGQTVTPHDSGYYQNYFLYYACQTGTCSDGATEYSDAGHWSTFGPLAADNYAIDINMDNGQILATKRHLPGIIDLPFVAGASMNAQWDDGNLVLSWSNSGPNWEAVDQQRVVLFDGSGNEVLYVALAANADSVTLPAALVAQAAALKGGIALAQWRIQTLAFNDYGLTIAASYSNKVSLVAPKYAIGTILPPNITYCHYESGTDADRYQIVTPVTTNNRGPVAQTDIANVVVTDSQGNELLPDNNIYYQIFFMWYNCLTENCAEPIQIADTGIRYIYEDLSPGHYEVQIEMENGQLLSYTNEFPGMLELPYVAGASMISRWNDGDLELSWDNPTTAQNWDQVDQLRIVLFDNQGRDVLYVRPGPDGESVTIPAALVAQAASLQYDTALVAWQIQTRAFDDNNMNFARGYSNKVSLTVPQYALNGSAITYRNFESDVDYCLATSRLTVNSDPIEEANALDMVMKSFAGQVLAPASSGYYQNYFLWYHCETGTCDNDVKPYADAGLWSTFGPLATDAYGISINMDNGQILATKRYFPGIVELPYVASVSMNAHWADGDLVLSWSNSQPNWAAVDQQRVVLFDNGGSEVLYISLAANANSVTLPAALVAQAAMLKGGSALAKWRIQTQAFDDYGMTIAAGYSDLKNL